MNKSQFEKPDYGNWVPNKLIYMPGIIGLVLVGIALFFPIFFLLAIFFLLVSAYFAYAQYLFSPRGGNVQEKVAEQVVFQKASASSLPFNDESFDAAVSNLVFHEVADKADKSEFIPPLLKLPFMVGTLGMIVGEK